jgi:plasmid stabilization system protein ParE
VNVKLAPGAEQDLTDGALYYAREAGPDLGHAFIAEFERSIGLLALYPTLGAPWRRGIRRLPLRRFPFSIIYRLGPSDIEVFAVAHQRRKLGYWQRRA